MIVIGITGSLASGKSEAVRIFKEKKGAKVFDADLAARQVVEKGKPVYKAVFKIFGKEYFRSNGELDRKKLASHVFSHPEDLKKLNILIHPGVIFECFRMIEQNRKRSEILVLDVPLLFESKMESLADYTVLVTADPKKILQRAKKNGMPESLTRKILSTQWPLIKKRRLADFVIKNNGSLKELEKKVLEVAEKIKLKNKT